MRLPATLTAGMAAVICLYCMAMQHTHLVASPSQTADVNRYIQLREEGLMLPQDIEREDLREIIAGYYARDPGMWQPVVPDSLWLEMNCINWPDIHWLNNNAMAHHPHESVMMYLRNFQRAADYDLFYNPLYPPQAVQPLNNVWIDTNPYDPAVMVYPFYRLFRPQIRVGYVIGLWFVALWLWRWWRSGRFPALAYAVAAAMAGGYAVSIMGAPDDWARLVTPVNMLLPIMSASIFATFKGHYNNTNREVSEQER